MIHSAKPIVGSSLLRGTVIAATMGSVAQSPPGPCWKLARLPQKFSK